MPREYQHAAVGSLFPPGGKPLSGVITLACGAGKSLVGIMGSCVVVCDRVRPCVVVVVVSESSEAVVCGCEQSLIIRAHLKYFFYDFLACGREWPWVAMGGREQP